jgi:signal peptidase II
VKVKYRVLSVILPIVLGLDQLTKYGIVRKFRLSESVAVVSRYFNLTYVRNPGAAFGLLYDARESFRVPFFVIVPLISLLAIGYVFRKIGDSDIRLSAALSAVIGGATGNLIDRLHWGYVVDFLDLHWKYAYHFPAFNVADMSICAGVMALMLDLLQARRDESPDSPPSGETRRDSLNSKENTAHASTPL